MDIKILDSSLRQFINTEASADDIAKSLSLCGPTVDRLHLLDGGDYLYEIEAITNRVDTANVFGVARECSAILPKFGFSAELINNPSEFQSTDLPENHDFFLEISDDSLIKRFCAVSLKVDQPSESPESVKNLLLQSDLRPINNLVDITNELTLLYGIPSHIFDLDKIHSQKLKLRLSHLGETITTLDGQTSILKGNDIVFEDGSGRLIDLCGCMGGQLAEVDSSTTRILFIVPIYSPKYIRRTSLYTQKRTLAAQIYEKQPDSNLALSVLHIGLKLFHERAQAHATSSVFDYYPKPDPAKKVTFNLAWLNHFVGITFDTTEVIDSLSRLGFSCHEADGHLECLVPNFRFHDINIREDLAEEISRIHGYFRLPAVLPSTQIPFGGNDPVLAVERQTKNYLSGCGFNEIMNNSLISLETITQTGQMEDQHLRLINPLTTDAEYLRLSLVPSLLTNYANNQNLPRIKPLQLFEVGNTYLKDDTQELPRETSTLALVSDLDFRHFKGVLEQLFEKINLRRPIFAPVPKAPSLYIKESSGQILIGDQVFGFYGVINPKVARTYRLNSLQVTIAEINLQLLAKNVDYDYHFKPISTYPGIEEEITVTSEELLGQIIEKIRSVSPLISTLVYLYSYTNKHTFAISFVSQEKQLTQPEVEQIKQLIFELF